MAEFIGGNGDDVFNGSSQSDLAEGRGGNDTLNGHDGEDILAGGAGADQLDGGEGGDILFSADRSPPWSFPGNGNHTAPLLDTGTEIDILRGGAGIDRLFAGYGDNVDGGSDDGYGDYLYISFLGASVGISVDFRLATQTIDGGKISNVENLSWLQGSNFDDIFYAPNDSELRSEFTVMFGMGGNDQLFAGRYTGTMDGGDGDDLLDGRMSLYMGSLSGGDGNDTILMSFTPLANPTAYGGAGNDLISGEGTAYGGGGNDVINARIADGGDGDDDLTADSSGEIAAGGAGADIVRGLAGSQILGSAGFIEGTTALDWDMDFAHDRLSGGDGDDTLSIGYADDADGGAGWDTLRVSFGALTNGIVFDTGIIASGQPYTLGGGDTWQISGIEVFAAMRATNFDDVINVATQSDLFVINGADGHDRVTASASAVFFAGEGGGDHFVSGSAADIFDGGEGSDTADYVNAIAGLVIDMDAPRSEWVGTGGDSLISVENISGTDFLDRLTGNVFANGLVGRGGDDRLYGGGGNDTLIGGDGNDFLRGDEGADHLSGGTGADTYFVDSNDSLGFEEGSDYDLVYTTGSFGIHNAGPLEALHALDARSTNAMTLVGNSINNSIQGNDGYNALYGGGGDDTLRGFGSGDILDGQEGTDYLIGGLGDDIYYVDGLDTAEELVGQGYDAVYASTSYTLNTSSEVEMLATTNYRATIAISLSGNQLNNYIVGNNGNNVIDGRAGDDSLLGLHGDDLLIGGSGVDYMIGGDGSDIYYVDTGDTVIEDIFSYGNAVYTSSSYVLTPGSYVGTLGTIDYRMTDALDLTGNERPQAIIGSNGANVIRGLDGKDSIRGLDGNDRIDGGAGQDWMQGNFGNDVFVFSAASDSAVGQGDSIFEFVSGIDTIDLSAIDANSGTTIDDAFTLIGSDLFTGQAGQLRIDVRDGLFQVYGDINGDKIADLHITVYGPALVQSDFVL